MLHYINRCSFLGIDHGIAFSNTKTFWLNTQSAYLTNLFLQVLHNKCNVCAHDSPRHYEDVRRSLGTV